MDLLGVKRQAATIEVFLGMSFRLFLTCSYWTKGLTGIILKEREKLGAWTPLTIASLETSPAGDAFRPHGATLFDAHLVGGADFLTGVETNPVVQGVASSA